MRTETARQSCYFNGSKLFNEIPNEMKDLNSVLIFKTRILGFFFLGFFFAGPLLMLAF